jgi:hypothetical protein
MQVTELRAVEPPLRSKVAKLAGAAKQDSAGPSSSVSIKQVRVCAWRAVSRWARSRGTQVAALCVLTCGCPAAA